MHIHIFSLFREMFQGPFQHSVIKRAAEKGLVHIELHDLRDYARDRHRTADDYQYGGGPGMILKPEPAFEGVDAVLSRYPPEVRTGIPVILMSPQGRRFDQAIAAELSRGPDMLLLCGHYGGVDERIREHLATDDICIGDYVLTGGELAAMVVVDAVVRLIPGVVGSAESVEGDSITSGFLQHPLYTRPPAYRDVEVPPVLISGNHGEIARWRRQQSLLRTLKRRPDLLETARLSPEDLEFLGSRGYRRD